MCSSHDSVLYMCRYQDFSAQASAMLSEFHLQKRRPVRPTREDQLQRETELLLGDYDTVATVEEVLDKEMISEADDLFLTGYFLSLLMGRQETCLEGVADLCTDDVLRVTVGDCVRVAEEELVLPAEKLGHLRK